MTASGFVLFDTAIGRCGIAWGERGVAGVQLPEAGEAETRARMLQRFPAVTVLNGHIHQVMQKVEGNVTFHSAMSTAFPQPAPGTAPSPGPMKVPAEQLHGLLGITDVNFVRGQQTLAIVDSNLA